jgi:putative ABC transport system permease protein
MNARDELAHDVRAAWRSVRARPAFAAIVMATLAVGLGANAAVFGLLDAVVLKPLSYAEPERLVRLYQYSRENPAETTYLTEPSFTHLAEHARTLDVAGLYTYDVEGVDITDGDRPERIRALRTTPDYFDVLGVAPVHGRVFDADEARARADEDVLGSERTGTSVAVVSESLWRRRLGGAGDAVGRTITLDGVAHTVVGVLPAAHRDPLTSDVDVWLPLPLRSAGFEDWEWDNHWLSAIARLAPGVTREQAQAELERLSGLQAGISTNAESYGIRAVPLHDDVIGAADALLWMLMGAVGVLLLITCVNVAGLMVAQAAAREKELAVRAALGSPRRRLVRQLLFESLTLSLVGGAAGLAVAVILARGLTALAPAGLLPDGAPGFDAQLFGFGLGLAIVAGLVSGLWPAVRAARSDPVTALREAGRGASDARGAVRVRSVLVMLQLALALVLLAGAGVLLRSFDRLRALDLGIRPAAVWTFEVHLPDERYVTADARARFYRTLADRLAALPGVAAAGAVSHLPATGISLTWGAVPWTEAGERDGDMTGADQRVVEGDYFEAAGIPIVRGRTFGPEDVPEAESRVVIGEELARRLFADRDPVGRLVRIANRPRRVIGVAGDAAVSARGDLQPMVYHAHTQFAANRSWSLTQVVRLERDDPGFPARARSELAALDPLLVLHQPRRMEDVIGRGVAAERFAATLVSAFSALALLLVALGLYGVLAYTVSRRRREIGIRIALGARGAAVRGMIVGQGMRLVAAGVAGGLIAALVAVRALESLVFGVAPWDPAAFAGAVGVLVVVALVACWLPSAGATRTDPMRVLGRE